MGRRISFSADVLRIEEVAQKQREMEKSLYFYYTSPGLPQRDLKFVGYSPDEIRLELEKRLSELDRDCSFSILSALEARFRTDFLNRCYDRRKDDLSRYFRTLYQAKGHRVALEKDILDGWKRHVPAAKSLISEIVGALRYRHWLAHGCYWEPKFGKRYDFSSLYYVAQLIEAEFEEN